MKRVVVILSLALIACACVAAYLYLDARIKIEPRQFDKDKQVKAAELYDRVMTDSYPTSPEGVMDLFNDAFYLMYAKMIINDGTLFEVMMKQRELYSNELKSLTTEDVQFANLKNMLSELYDSNYICLSVERKGTVYDERTPAECTVQVSIYYKDLGYLYRNYYLKHEDGYWRIHGWLTTDENYTDTRG